MVERGDDVVNIRRNLQLWCDKARSEKKLSQMQIEERAGLPSGALSKIIHGTRQLRADELERIAEVLEVTVGTLHKAPVMNSHGEEAAHPPSVLPVEVISSAEAGFMGPTEWPVGQRYEVMALSDARIERNEVFALECRGPSADIDFPHGSVAICCPIHGGLQSIENDVYVVVRRRDERGAETTIRAFHKDAAGTVWLWPKSLHPLYQQPLMLPPAGDIEIAGVVIQVLRKNPRAR